MVKLSPFFFLPFLGWSCIEWPQCQYIKIFLKSRKYKETMQKFCYLPIYKLPYKFLLCLSLDLLNILWYALTPFFFIQENLGQIWKFITLDVMKDMRCFNSWVKNFDFTFFHLYVVWVQYQFQENRRWMLKLGICCWFKMEDLFFADIIGTTPCTLVVMTDNYCLRC